MTRTAAGAGTQRALPERRAVAGCRDDEILGCRIPADDYGCHDPAGGGRSRCKRSGLT